MPNSSQRVLLVDDDRAIRRSLRRLLVTQGHACVEAASGEEALAVVRQTGAAVVLLDLHLHEESGLTVLDALLRERPDLPVILITGSAEGPDVREALRRGAWAYLQKPLRAEELRATVMTALARRSSPDAFDATPDSSDAEPDGADATSSARRAPDTSAPQAASKSAASARASRMLSSIEQ